VTVFVYGAISIFSEYCHLVLIIDISVQMLPLHALMNVQILCLYGWTTTNTSALSSSILWYSMQNCI